MLYPQSKLLVFCKAPEAGKVKTRLSSFFEKRGMDGNKIAARIHEYLVLHSLQNITQMNVAPVQLWCAPDSDHAFFQKCKKLFNLELKKQGEGDLGKRMSNAYNKTLKNNDCAVIVGTDCPGLSRSAIEEAFTLLHHDKCSVIGPAEDGGYFLLGLQEVQPEIFKDISWGSPQVYVETTNKMSGPVRELSTLWDIDRPDDLERLLKEATALELSQEFREYIASVI